MPTFEYSPKLKASLLMYLHSVISYVNPVLNKSAGIQHASPTIIAKKGKGQSVFAKN